MAKKRVFISFDYDHDRHYRYLLRAWVANLHSEIDFDDRTPEEIQSDDISRIKAVLTRRIREATHTLVIIGEHANSYHSKWMEIGYRNWQWWEINKSVEEGKGFIAVKIHPLNEAPGPLYNRGATWAMNFTVDAILQAIRKA